MARCAHLHAIRLRSLSADVRTSSPNIPLRYPHRLPDERQNQLRAGPQRRDAGSVTEGLYGVHGAQFTDAEEIRATVRRLVAQVPSLTLGKSNPHTPGNGE